LLFVVVVAAAAAFLLVPFAAGRLAVAVAEAADCESETSFLGCICMIGFLLGGGGFIAGILRGLVCFERLGLVAFWLSEGLQVGDVGDGRLESNVVFVVFTVIVYSLEALADGGEGIAAGPRSRQSSYDILVVRLGANSTEASGVGGSLQDIFI